jgi:hypothetical protein
MSEETRGGGAVGTAPEHMGYPLTDEGLRRLAEEVGGGRPTHQAADALTSMFRDRTLAEAAGGRYRELDDRWHGEFDAWKAAVDRAKESGAAEVYSTQAMRSRGLVLGALLSREAEVGLRAEARAAATAEARSVSWYADLGDPEQARPGDVLAMVALGPVAEEAARDRRRDRSASRKRFRGRLITGAVLVGLLGYVVYAIVSGDDVGGTQAGDGDTPGQSEEPAFQNVLYTAVVSEATPIYEEADETTTAVTELEQFAVVHIIDESNPDWYQVRLPEEEETAGWVPRDLVQIRCQGRCRVG